MMIPLDLAREAGQCTMLSSRNISRLQRLARAA